MTGLYAMGQKMKETKKIKIQNCQYVQCQLRKYKTVKEISIMKTISQHAREFHGGLVIHGGLGSPGARRSIGAREPPGALGALGTHGGLGTPKGPVACGARSGLGARGGPGFLNTPRGSDTLWSSLPTVDLGTPGGL
jgi:hypothetical protein